MKYCEAYAALLDMYVDGELAPEEMVRVRTHLETCPGCQAYVDDALAIRVGFPEVEDTVVPDGFTADVMERIRKSSIKNKKITELKRHNAYRWGGTLAVLAACCALVIFVRTGFNNSINSRDGMIMVTASDSAGTPAAYDTGGDEADKIAPQTAPEEPAERAAGEKVGVRAAADGDSPADAASMDGGIKERGDMQLAAAPTEAAIEETTLESQEDTVFTEGIDKSREAALYLNDEEAGELLNGFTLIREEAGEKCYELTAEEYRMLLAALGRQNEMPETVKEAFLVVVTVLEYSE